MSRGNCHNKGGCGGQNNLCGGGDQSASQRKSTLRKKAKVVKERCGDQCFAVRFSAQSGKIQKGADVKRRF